MQEKHTVTLLLFFVLINSCKTDFNTIAPYKEITVVYGLLDPDPSVKYQYIKINKAFLGEGNALLMAQQKDSINYAPGVLNVQLQQVNSGQVVRTIQFDTTTIVPKDPGIFSNPYQVLYRNKDSLTIAQDGSTYNLVIYNSRDKKTLSSTTAVVQRIDPSFFVRPGPHETIDLTDTTAKYKILFNAAINARLYSLIIVIHYSEKNLITGDSSAKILNWSQGTEKSQFLNGLEQISFTFNPVGFYGFVRNQIKINPTVKRFASSELDFVITYCGDDLSTYIDVNQPSIGIIQEKAEFTNIKNGIGIFSSRTTLTFIRSMDQTSFDTLTYGSVTGVLFQ